MNFIFLLLADLGNHDTPGYDVVTTVHTCCASAVERGEISPCTAQQVGRPWRHSRLHHRAGKVVPACKPNAHGRDRPADRQTCQGGEQQLTPRALATNLILLATLTLILIRNLVGFVVDACVQHALGLRYGVFRLSNAAHLLLQLQGQFVIRCGTGSLLHCRDDDGEGVGGASPDSTDSQHGV